jgi:hypothetical protein
MKVISFNTVKGRGVIMIVDAIPVRLRSGMLVNLVADKDRQWRVSGIEVLAKYLENRPQEIPGGLLLTGNSPLPEVGDELEMTG